MTGNARHDIAPAPAYFPTSSDSPLHPPKELYSKLASLKEEKGELVKKDDFVIPPRSGKAWTVGAGQVFRLSTPEGPQVGDLNLWNQHDPRERFWAARTRQLHSSHMEEGDRLWSNLPFMRPLAGMIRDGCKIEDGRYANGESRLAGGKVDERGQVTKWGGRCHDLLGTRCDPYVNTMLTSTTYNHHCHSNLVRAVLPFSLTEFDIHDVLNVFQVTGLDDQGRYFMEASPATSDSFVDFFAELDLLCALSTCPGGDLSAWGWQEGEEGKEGEGAQDEMKETCRPIRVEVFEIEERVREEVLRGWKRSERSGYKGMHGIGIPVGEGV